VSVPNSVERCGARKIESFQLVGEELACDQCAETAHVDVSQPVVAQINLDQILVYGKIETFELVVF